MERNNNINNNNARKKLAKIEKRLGIKSQLMSVFFFSFTYPHIKLQAKCASHTFSLNSRIKRYTYFFSPVSFTYSNTQFCTLLRWHCKMEQKKPAPPSAYPVFFSAHHCYVHSSLFPQQVATRFCSGDLFSIAIVSDNNTIMNK